MKIPEIFIPKKDLEQSTNKLLNEKVKKEDPRIQFIDDKGVYEYENVHVSIMKKAFFKTRFKPEESNAVIEDTVAKVAEYAQSKGRAVEIFRTYDTERVRKAKIISNDGIVKVNVYYKDECNPVIHAELNFNSSRGADMEEYKGLAKIVGEIGKDYKFVI